ncbi:hypothetical protein GCM10010252_74590 [Streptomyces aureoverticillatus]|nr:hypothetical protein GCM10010252_74590 [Streptomyces aureoverticillatus]
MAGTAGARTAAKAVAAVTAEAAGTEAAEMAVGVAGAATESRSARWASAITTRSLRGPGRVDDVVGAACPVLTQPCVGARGLCSRALPGRSCEPPEYPVKWRGVALLS